MSPLTATALQLMLGALTTAVPFTVGVLWERGRRTRLLRDQFAPGLRAPSNVTVLHGPPRTSTSQMPGVGRA